MKSRTNLESLRTHCTQPSAFSMFTALSLSSVIRPLSSVIRTPPSVKGPRN